MPKSNLSWIPNLEVIAWDLDGTLYPSSPGLDEAFQRRKISAVASALHCSTRVAEEFFADTYSRLKSNTAVLESVGIDGQTFILNIWETVPLESYISPNPALAAKLSELAHKSNLPIVMLTNSNSQETVRRKLSCIGIDPAVFTAIYTSIEIGKTKPHPEAFTPLYQNHASSPENVLYIGDRIETDIAPAHALGIRTAFITNDTNTSVHEAVDMQDTHAVALCDQIISLL